MHKKPNCGEAANKNFTVTKFRASTLLHAYATSTNRMYLSLEHHFFFHLDQGK